MELLLKEKDKKCCNSDSNIIIAEENQCMNNFNISPKNESNKEKFEENPTKQRIKFETQRLFKARAQQYTICI